MNEILVYRTMDSGSETHVDVSPISVARKPNKVEIVSHGASRLMFLNGARVGSIISLETPRELNDIAGRVCVTFLADEITERLVSVNEYRARASEA